MERLLGVRRRWWRALVPECGGEERRAEWVRVMMERMISAWDGLKAVRMTAGVVEGWRKMRGLRWGACDDGEVAGVMEKMVVKGL